MDVVATADAVRSATRNYRIARLALNNLPDQCVRDLGELATRIGVEQRDLVTWAGADFELARLIAAKVAA